MESEKSGTINLSFAGRLALLFAGILSSFAQGGLVPLLPDIAAYFAGQPGAAFLTRTLVSVIGLMIAFTSPFMGALADRYGNRRILLISMATYTVAGMSGFFLDNLYALLAMRVVVGLAVAAAGAIMLAIVVNYSEGAARHRWLGYIGTVGTLCGLVLIPLSGFIGDFGWHWPFLLHGLAFPLFILAYVGLEPDKPVRHAHKDTMDGTRARLPVVFLLLAMAVGTLLSTSLLYVPFHVRDLGITDASKISLAILPASLGAAASAYVYGKVRTRLSLPATFVLAFGISATGLILTYFSQTFTQVAISQGIMGCSIGLMATNIYALASMVGPDSQRAQTMGLAKGGLFSGPIVGQLVLEPIVARTNASLALLLLGLFAASLMVFYIWRTSTNRSATA